MKPPVFTVQVPRVSTRLDGEFLLLFCISSTENALLGAFALVSRTGQELHVCNRYKQL